MDEVFARYRKTLAIVAEANRLKWEEEDRLAAQLLTEAIQIVWGCGWDAAEHTANWIAPEGKTRNDLRKLALDTFMEKTWPQIKAELQSADGGADEKT